MEHKATKFRILLPADGVREILDKMRLIANGKLSLPAHVTVAGPFCRKVKIKMRTVEAFLDGVGMERYGDEYIVWLKLRGDFRKIWKKRDFPNGVPHITIYKGEDRSWAERVAHALQPLQGVRARMSFPKAEVIDVEKKHDLERNTAGILGSAEIRDAFGSVWEYVQTVGSQDAEDREKQLRRLAKELVGVLRKGDKETQECSPSEK